MSSPISSHGRGKGYGADKTKLVPAVARPPSPTVDDEAHHVDPDAPTYTGEPARILAVVEFSCLTAGNAVQWTNYSMVPNEANAYFGLSSAEINALSAAYELSTVLAIPLIVWFFRRFGFKAGLLVCAGCNVLGGTLKLLAALFHVQSFPLLYVPQMLLGLASAVCITVPPQVAMRWFPAHERTLACTAAAMANNFGLALGMLLPSWFVTPQSHGRAAWATLFGAQLAFTVVDAAVLLFLVPPGPTQPPSVAAAARGIDVAAAIAPTSTNDDDADSGGDVARGDDAMGNATSGVSFAWKQRPPWFLLLAVSWSVALGLVWTISALLPQLLTPFGISERAAGQMGFASILVGSIVAYAIGAAVDRHRVYRAPLAVLVAGCGALLAAITALLAATPDAATPSLGAVFALYIALGVCQGGMVPIGFEFAVELSFPYLDESTSGGILMWGANFLGLVTLFAFPPAFGLEAVDGNTTTVPPTPAALRSPAPVPSGDGQRAVAVRLLAAVAALNVAAAIGSACVAGRLRRRAFERGESAS